MLLVVSSTSTIQCAWAKAQYDEQHPSRGIVSGEELRRLFVVHMNFRLALRFPHRKHYIGLRWGPRWYWMVQLLASRVLLIVGRTLDHPVPGFEGFLTSGEVLLGDEGHLVLRDLAQVLATIADSRCNR